MQTVAIKILEKEFFKRKARNSRYSLRRFSLSLDVPASRLSDYLNGKRSISKHVGKKIVERLNLSPDDKCAFLKSVFSRGYEFQIEKSEMMEESQFEIISDPIHFALMSLMQTSSYKSCPKWISKRLGVSVSQAKKAIHRLLESQIVEVDKKGNWKLSTDAQFQTPDEVPSEANRQAHGKILGEVERALEEIAIEFRHITATTFCADLEKLSLAKSMIRQFSCELVSILESDKADEVYRLAIQLFPVTFVEQK